MTARMLITCAAHPLLLLCEDDDAYDVATAASARALHAAQYRGVCGKTARVAITCEIGGCPSTITVAAESIAEGRARAAGHNYGWYTARRARGLVVDACQYHLGTCCIGHARPDSPTLDPNAVLPTGAPERPLVFVQPSLFEEVA